MLRLCLSIALAVLAACSNESSEQQIASAKNYLEKGELSAAIIQLQNALAQTPDMVEARILLGKTLLENGEPVLAVIEFEKAVSLGASPDPVVALLARALLEAGDSGDRSAVIMQLRDALAQTPDMAQARILLGKMLLESGEPVLAAVEFEKAVGLSTSPDPVVAMQARALLEAGDMQKLEALDASSTLTEPQATADFKTTMATAYEYRGEAQKAKVALDAALRARPNHAPALAVQARSLVNRGDFDGAAPIVDRILAASPNDGEALIVRADILLYGRKDKDGAIAAYRKAVASRPTDVMAHSALIEALLAVKDVEGARTQTGALNELRPKHPHTLYFRALLAAQAGDLKTADDLVNRLLDMSSGDPRVLFLAAQLALQQDQPRLAQARATQLVAKAPSFPGASQLLARASVRAGDPAKAIEALEPLLDGANVDAATLTMGASAYMMRGDFTKAQELYARAAKKDPSAGQARVGALVARYLKGDTGQALQELQALAVADRGTDIDLTLVSALLNRRDWDGALRGIERMEAKAPGKPMAAQLRGQVLMLKGDLVGARKALDASLAADPTYFPAVDRLAALDWREGKRDAARDRFKAYLKANPNDPRPMVGLATVLDQLGTPPAEVAKMYSDAVAARPGEVWLRRNLVQFHLSKRDLKQALVSAQNASSAMPGNVDLLELLASTQLAVGEVNQAIKSYSALTRMRPMSASAFLGLADAYIAAKSYTDAAEAVKRAAALAPDSLAVAMRGVKIEAATGRHDAAVSRARALQVRVGPVSDILLLEGDIEASRRNWVAAEAAYRKLLLKDPASVTAAQRIYATLRSTGEKARTEAFAAEWQRAHPKDPHFPFFLAGVAIGSKDYPGAETLLQQVLRLDPDNAMANNNLAWVLAMQQKPGARELAEKAVRLAPNEPLALDTLALVMAEDGNLPEAVDAQKRAVALAPAAPDLRLSLARLYVKAGNKPDAREELGALAALGKSFDKQAEVRRLQAQLDR